MISLAETLEYFSIRRSDWRGGRGGRASVLANEHVLRHAALCRWRLFDSQFGLRQAAGRGIMVFRGFISQYLLYTTPKYTDYRLVSS